MNLKLKFRLFSSIKQCYFELTQNNNIGIITLNKPDTKNALGRTLVTELQQAVQEANRSDARVLILRSQVEKIFCAGANLKERLEMNEDDVVRFVDELRSTFTMIEECSLPTIAAIDGAALGGGLEMALACDLRYAGVNGKMGLPEAKLAIIPGAGGTQRLPRLIGIPKSKELMFRGMILNSKASESIGLVNEASDDGFSTALSVAQEIIQNGPIALKMLKVAVNLGIQCDLKSALNIEKLCYAQIVPTADRIEALKAFSEKRKPVFSGK